MAAGTQVGAYRILGLLGEGGMGIVYRAEQQNPQRIVALKVIRLGVASTEHLRRFEQEAELLGRLQHPGIAHIMRPEPPRAAQGPSPTSRWSSSRVPQFFSTPIRAI